MNETSLANKRIAKNTMLLYFRSIVILAIGLYTSRVTLQILGVQDYGIYNLVGSVVAMFSLIGGAMSSASQRFIMVALGKGDSLKLKETFMTSVSLHVILGVFFIIILEIAGIWLLENKLDVPIERIQAAKYVFQFSILTAFVNIVSIPYDALIIAHEKMNAFAYISIFEAVMKLLSVLILECLTWDKLIVYGILLLCIAIVKRVLYNLYSYIKFDEARTFKLHISSEIFKEMFSFASWNLLGNGAYVLRNQGVDVLLNMFLGVTVNAARGICNQVQGAIFQFIINFQTAITPQLTKSVAVNDLNRTLKLVFTGSRVSFYLMMFFSVPVLISAREILEIWLVHVPDYTVSFLWWTVILLLEECLNRFLINAIMAYGKIKQYQLIVAITKLFVIPISYVALVLGAEPEVVFVVNLALDVACLAERLYFNKKFFGLKVMSYFKEVIFPCWMLFFAAMLILSFVHEKIILNGIAVIPISVIVTIFLIVLVGCNTNERTLLKKNILKKIKKGV